jgi:hypothetical protein
MISQQFQGSDIYIFIADSTGLELMISFPNHVDFEALILRASRQASIILTL